MCYNNFSMLYDLTLPITKEMTVNAEDNERKNLSGHIGTHFDIMDKTFPLTYGIRKAVVFSVTSIRDRDISLSDIALDQVEEGMAVLFHTGFLKEKGYGTQPYLKEHPQLSQELIKALLEKKVSLIGIDATGIRRSKEHTPADQLCADHGAFVIENVAHLETLPAHRNSFVLYTFPMHLVGYSGVPVRMVADC